MNIILFTHPQFMKSQSMPRFARLISDGMKNLGHNVDIWSPKPIFYKLPAPTFLKKWLGYIDQYFFFPMQVKKRLKYISSDTLFVFADQALGPWVPLVKNRPHVIHCHDFLAQRSALGEIKENPTKLSGKLYQQYIHRGYKQGQNFISVSEETKEDLHRFLSASTEVMLSEVVYNGLNQDFKIHDFTQCRHVLSNLVGRDLTNGYILHVGGNQWYKNRLGVIQIYDKWRTIYPDQFLTLLMVGVQPSDSIVNAFEQSAYKKDIIFVTNLSDVEVQMAYAGSCVFLFPSLAEGFGWPIAEAMASGSLVLTTNQAPMTEVSGDAAILLPVQNKIGHEEWVISCAEIVQKAITMPDVAKEALKLRGFKQIEKFNTADMLKRVEELYKQISTKN